MKKLNKKGFTLIELLAVIVVLAVIMVIATQQVNKTIRKSRSRAYADSVLSIKKSAKLSCAEAGLTQTGLNEVMDKTDDISAVVSGNNVIVTIKTDGKFANMDLNELKKQTSTGVTFTNATVVNNYQVTITNPCEY